MKRTILLLSAPELTPRQIAQRKYQQSHKGKAASRRHQRKKRQDPAFRAAEAQRVRTWEKANPTKRRVYKRIWQATKKRLQAANDATFRQDVSA